MFMSAERQAAERNSEPGPQDQGQDRRGHLLGLVRRILDYGRDLMASLQHQNASTPSPRVAWAFGTIDLAVIIARITRGLLIARALEARLVRQPPTQEQPEPRRPRAPAKPRPARPKSTPQPNDDHGLPSAEAIAARIRGRQAGAVIVEICRELGINTMHPLWPDIRDAIRHYNGSLARMMTAWMQIAADSAANGALDWPSPLDPTWPEPAVAATGPP